MYKDTGLLMELCWDTPSKAKRDLRSNIKALPTKYGMTCMLFLSHDICLRDWDTRSAGISKSGLRESHSKL